MELLKRFISNFNFNFVYFTFIQYREQTLICNIVNSIRLEVVSEKKYRKNQLQHEISNCNEIIVSELFYFFYNGNHEHRYGNAYPIILYDFQKSSL